jgi:3-phenylpropionate/trans-cinnamate dioxygenase ferredoxin reductase component
MAANERIGNVIIVGAGIGGASAAEALRRDGFDGRIVLLGAEREPPYERPLLSKGYLLGTVDDTKVTLRQATDYAAEGIDLRLGERAAALDVADRTVALASGERLAFDRLLIATGSDVRRLDVSGEALSGVRYLRTLDDARALKADLDVLRAAGGRVVVIGAGFIGAEVAADCRELGLEVTLLEILAAPMVRAVGEEMGAWLAEVHRAHGVDLRLGEGVAALRGAGRVEEVVTTSGARIPCALVVAGLGVRPADAWLRGSGLDLDDGVRVDAFCETSAPGIFAVGDMARWPYHPAGAEHAEWVRVEHWDNALRQGEAAARNLLGRHMPFAPVPYFWSDQYDLKLHFVGLARSWDRVVLRGWPRDGTFIAFYLAAGRVTAALSANRVRDLVPLKRLVGTTPDETALADDHVDLRSLATEQRSTC